MGTLQTRLTKDIGAAVPLPAATTAALALALALVLVRAVPRYVAVLAAGEAPATPTATLPPAAASVASAAARRFDSTGVQTGRDEVRVGEKLNEPTAQASTVRPSVTAEAWAGLVGRAGGQGWWGRAGRTAASSARASPATCRTGSDPGRTRTWPADDGSHVVCSDGQRGRVAERRRLCSPKSGWHKVEAVPCLTLRVGRQSHSL